MSKIRVVHFPQIGCDAKFIVPVETSEEAKKLVDILSAYDLFQLNNNIKPDFSNASFVEMFNEETEEWEDWYLEEDGEEFYDIDEWYESKYGEEITEAWNQAIFGQGVCEDEQERRINKNRKRK